MLGRIFNRLFNPKNHSAGSVVGVGVVGLGAWLFSASGQEWLMSMFAESWHPLIAAIVASFGGAMAGSEGNTAE